ncbi:hypothetical protein DDB_G0277689 [Dictyostelium discoideum AX4]|uniref:Peptidase C14 caspase domain-containing protein n=1 Tax=Dictyostelium discoideum TaxID=44689 RepID=Q54ZB4_DICDI|nr:hypothetical protein DDB_G0277689 [Dictyostelium discoideum AX4]EAL68602.1 hypothetical protein DDB_G0277689 [Dictyostelium discoideum AX4]|eukprot:XP_642523.1 hypothetical protein DDB_G0277689 [Dictyostelium discoideum AX4]
MITEASEQEKILDILFEEKKEKVAFVCGNTYQDNPDYRRLSKVENDVIKMTEVLTKCGFKCYQCLNKDSILIQFDKFLKSIVFGLHMEIVFYFSGHGFVGNNNNNINNNNINNNNSNNEDKFMGKKHLLLVNNIKRNNENELPLNKRYASLIDIVKKLEAKEAIIRTRQRKKLDEDFQEAYQPIDENASTEEKEKNQQKKKLNSMFLDIEFRKVFILDCCRNDLNLKNYIESEKLENMERPDTAFLYGCTPGSVSYILSNDENSLLTSCFLRRIQSDEKKEKSRNLSKIAKVIQIDIANKLSGLKSWGRDVKDCFDNLKKLTITSETTTTTSTTTTLTETDNESSSNQEKRVFNATFSIEAAAATTIEQLNSKIIQNENEIEIEKEKEKQIEKERIELIGDIPPEIFSKILKVKTNLLYGDITMGNFIFYDQKKK